MGATSHLHASAKPTGSHRRGGRRAGSARFRGRAGWRGGGELLFEFVYLLLQGLRMRGGFLGDAEKLDSAGEVAFLFLQAREIHRVAGLQNGPNPAIPLPGTLALLLVGSISLVA